MGEKAEGWVFPARIGDGHLTRIENAWSRVRIRAGLPDVRTHDMRRTFATVAARLGIRIDDISSTLNHTHESVTRKHYICDRADNKKDVLASVGEHVRRLKR